MSGEGIECGEINNGPRADTPEPSTTSQVIEDGQR